MAKAKSKRKTESEKKADTLRDTVIEDENAISIPTYTEADIDEKKVSIERACSDEVKAIRKEVLEKVLTKKGAMCLLNDVVKHYNNGLSDPQLHTRLRNIFHKPPLGVKILKKEERLFIIRTK